MSRLSTKQRRARKRGFGAKWYCRPVRLSAADLEWLAKPTVDLIAPGNALLRYVQEADARGLASMAQTLSGMYAKVDPRGIK